jgi:O-antigen ligase
VSADIVQIEPVGDEGKGEARSSVTSVRGRDPVDWGLFYLVLGGLAWAPLWFGSDRIFPWAVNALWFAALTFVYEGNIIFRSRHHPFGLKQLRAPAVMFALVVFWIFLQNSTVFPVALQHPIYGMASDVLGQQLDGSISVNRDLTTLALMRLLTAACAFWLVLQLTRNPERAHLLLRAVGLIAAVYAVYGLVDAATGGTMSGFAPEGGGLFVRATFKNRNSFATYAGLGLLANSAVLFRSYRHALPNGESWQMRLGAFLEAAGSRGLFEIATTLALLAALLLSGSRGGIVASLLGLVALGLLTFGRSPKRGTEQIEMVLFMTLVVVGAFYLFGDVFAGRIATSGLVDAGRLAVYDITLQSILDAPFTGFGYGTFQDVFPMYRDQSVSIVEAWDMAHNTYLEVLQGLGVIGGALLIGTVVILVWYCGRGVLQRRQGFAPATVGLSASLLVGTHALVDFSLQIQAVSLTFTTLLAAGVAQSISSRRATAD